MVNEGTGAGHLQTDPAHSGGAVFCLEARFLAGPASGFGEAPRLFRNDQEGGMGSGQLPEWDQRGHCHPPCGGRRVGTRSTGVLARWGHLHLSPHRLPGPG